MQRVLGFLYGLTAYVIFLATFVYAAGFVGNFLVPKTLDSPLGGSPIAALVIDLVLLGLFVLQHSGMARPAFKRWLTRFVPKPLERSTYVLASSLALIALFVFWRPFGGIVWELESPLGRSLMILICAAGWLTVLVSTFLINHFDLFGLRQVWFYLHNREYEPLKFSTPGLYRYVRHPLYVGWLLAFWATPVMSTTHLLFAIMTTTYILGAIQLEERDLMEAHEEYAEYRRRVPALVPRRRAAV